MAATHEPEPLPIWAVHRQDDNGNRFVVQTGLTRAESEELVRVYERRGHKQLYWAVAESAPESTRLN